MIQNVKTNNRRTHYKPSVLVDKNAKLANKEQLISKEIVPEGYMTSEEFWKVSRESIDNICRKHGLL